MSARDDWQRIPASARRALITALSSKEVQWVVLEALRKSGDQLPEYDMKAVRRRQQLDIDAALAVLEEA